MGKKMLLGLGAVAGACFMVSKKLTEEQREKIAMKVDEIILDGRDKALKYDCYAREFIKENDFGGLKDRIIEKTKKYASDNKSVDDALESLKRATKDLKDHLEETGKNLKDLADVETEDVEIGYDEPEDDWKAWYDSFDLVKGVEALNIEEVKNEMRLRKDELFSTMNGAGSYFTIKSMASMLFKNEPTKEQKKSVSNAVHELFHDCKPESNPSYYSKVLCRERLNEIEMSEGNEVNDYFAGTNHVLPTNSTARFASGLNVDDFIKRTSVVYYSEKTWQQNAPKIARLARLELGKPLEIPPHRHSSHPIVGLSSHVFVCTAQNHRVLDWRKR